MDDWELRRRIYASFAAVGVSPQIAEVAAWVGGEAAARDALRRLHDAHAIVLDAAGQIRMALPFSAVPTEHLVRHGGRAWWANCAWDALAIPAALGIDAAIDANWLDTGEPVELEVRDGNLSSVDGFVHFAVPARHWWDDIGET
ncbi:MAG TPA: organomercurial lyase [Acidimicrobiia bacterium]|nr:organomercurial lyase [Acidimicrobiia bacterium]